MASNVVRSSLGITDEYLNFLCDPCRFNGKTAISMKYCRECNGHLCLHCVNAHLKGTNTKTHNVSYVVANRGVLNTAAMQRSIAAQVYKSLETKCADHAKLVVSYCMVHDVLCCRVCIGTTHRQCKLQVLSEAASGSKDSRELRQLETVIYRMQARFEEIHRQKQLNLQHMEQQMDTFSNSVKTYKMTLHKILDKLEEALLKRKERLYELKSEELKGSLKACQTAINVLSGTLNNLEIAVRGSNEEHIFLAIKKVQILSKRYEKVYMEMEKMPKHYGIVFQPDPSIDKFLKSLQELGKIKEENFGSNGPHSALKTKERGSDRRLALDLDENLAHTSADSHGRQRSPRKPQRILSPKASTSDEFNARLQSDKKNCSISGIAFLPDDKIVAADATNKKIKVFSADMKPFAHFETLTAPRDVATISNQDIACTLPNDKCVQVLQLGKEITVKKSIKLDVECYGLAVYENDMYITSGWSTEKEILVIDMEGVVKRTLKPKAGVLKCPLYVTIDPKLHNVYVSDYENGVVGMDQNGSIIFRYQDTSTKGFMGICSSPNADLYICTLHPNGVSRVPMDNKIISSIQSLNDPELEPVIVLPSKGSQRSRSIAYSQKSNKLVISFVGQSIDNINICYL